MLDFAVIFVLYLFYFSFFVLFSCCCRNLLDFGEIAVVLLGLLAILMFVNEILY